jgi:hypothetical protein
MDLGGVRAQGRAVSTVAYVLLAAGGGTALTLFGFWLGYCCGGRDELRRQVRDLKSRQQPQRVQSIADELAKWPRPGSKP